METERKQEYNNKKWHAHNKVKSKRKQKSEEGNK
jgi:hypothetical protein